MLRRSKADIPCGNDWTSAANRASLSALDMGLLASSQIPAPPAIPPPWGFGGDGTHAVPNRKGSRRCRAATRPRRRRSRPASARRSPRRAERSPRIRAAAKPNRRRYLGLLKQPKGTTIAAIRTVLTAQYDDGGYSGGTMERPALQRLLADIEAGQVDVIVVYKV